MFSHNNTLSFGIPGKSTEDLIGYLKKKKSKNLNQIIKNHIWTNVIQERITVTDMLFSWTEMGLLQYHSSLII